MATRDQYRAVMSNEVMLANVRLALTPDLLKPEYQGHSDNPTYGHCYVATEALFHLLGGYRSAFRPQFGRDNKGIVHWWLRDKKTGEILDPTVTQYTSVGREPPYAVGRNGGFLTREPSKRACIVMRRVLGSKV